MRLRNLSGFVSDLDGTIVPDGSMTVDDKLVSAFANIQSGVVAHIATGRTYEFCKPIFDTLGISQYAITENGARIVEPNSNKSVYELNLDEKITGDILKLCSSVVANAQCVFAGDSPETLTTVSERSPDINRGVFIIGLNRLKAEELTMSLSRLAVNVYISTSWENMEERCDVNIHHQYADKGTACKKLASLNGYNMRSLLAVGNDLNDLPMFDIAGVAAAPSDAHPLVRRRADYIIPPTSENGFLEVLKAFSSNR